MNTENRYPQLKGRVLIVEDNPANQLLFLRLVEKSHAHADCAVNGVQAVEMVVAESYDLVLMDICMPEMDGIEATQKIRQIHASLPIVALTANVLKQDQMNCIDAGMNDFLEKPVDKASFFDVLSKYLPVA